MAKHEIALSPIARDALAVLGQQIHLARVQRSWTLADVAARALVSVPTVRKIESGAPGTAIGHVLQVAYLVGVPLFGIEDPVELARLRRQGEDTLALIPTRVRSPRRRDVDDDF